MNFLSKLISASFFGRNANLKVYLKIFQRHSRVKRFGNESKVYRRLSRQNYKIEENRKTEKKDREKQESIRQIHRMATKRTHQNDKRRKDASEVMARRFRIEEEMKTV